MLDNELTTELAHMRVELGKVAPQRCGEPLSAALSGRPQRTKRQKRTTALAAAIAIPALVIASKSGLHAESGEQRLSSGADLVQAVTLSDASEFHLFLQIAVRPGREAAVAAFEDLQRKYPSLLGDRTRIISKVDMGERGVWYRVLVGPMRSISEAERLCEDLKVAGLKGCFRRME
jgi:hypothetical protein